MKKVQDMIYENLPGLWSEIESAFLDDQEGQDSAEAIIQLYTGVIGEMMKEYALQIVDEIVENLRYYTDVNWLEDSIEIDTQAVEKLKQQIRDSK